MQEQRTPVYLVPPTVSSQVLEGLYEFARNFRTGRITFHFKEGRVMQVETTEVKRV